MDFSKIGPDFKKEIVRSGEAYLDGQLRIATSADQRASSLAGVFTAAATALMVASIALSNSSWNVSGHASLVFGAGAASLMFLLGAIFCWTVIMPVEFWLPGCEPQNWESELAAGTKLEDCLGERASHIQKDISANHIVIQKNAKRFRWGAILGIAAPLIGVVVWSLCRLHGL